MSVELTAGATLEPLVLPASVDEAGGDLLEYAAVRNQIFAGDLGRDDHTLAPASLLALLRSNEYTQRQQWVIKRAGSVVGGAYVQRSTEAGDPVMLWTIALLPEHRGLGIGGAVYPHIEAYAREVGRRELHLYHEHPPSDAPPLTAATGIGAVPNDAAARFLTARGHSLAQVVRASALDREHCARQALAALRDDALAHAADYDVVQWTLPTPDEYIDGYAWVKSRMSTDAPSGDLTEVEETWDAARVRAWEERVAAFGRTVRVTAARHRTSGELCAFTELAQEADPKRLTHQEDTLVLAEHRGHRLGALIKCVAALDWWDAAPLSPRIATYNAEENRPMLAINEAMGFVPVGYEGAWKKVLA